MSSGNAASLETAAGAATVLRPPPVVVTALTTTAVKGLRIAARDEVMLTRAGVVDDRRFYLIDERAGMINGKRIGPLSAIRADYDHAARWLRLVFPDGSAVCETVRLGAEIETQFFSRRPRARLVEGPWADALSRYAGLELRLVEADPELGGVDRGPRGAVSLISQQSIAKLETLIPGRPVDARRFRMLVEVSGIEAHGEDDWVGETVTIGGARVCVRGHIGRCLVTSQSPDTGLIDMPTLKLLSYRRGVATTEPLAFGVFGEVVEPGVVRVGDQVSVD